jgi:hypothetical protein
MDMFSGIDIGEIPSGLVRWLDTPSPGSFTISAKFGAGTNIPALGLVHLLN